MSLVSSTVTLNVFAQGYFDPNGISGATPATTSLATFQSWPAAEQSFFIFSNSKTNPPQVVLGPAGGQQVLATLTADGMNYTEALITAEPLPSGFTLPPSTIDYVTFSSWSQNVEAAYMLANSAQATSDGTTLSLTCGSGTETFTATQTVRATTNLGLLNLAAIPAADVRVHFAPPNLADLTTGYTSVDIPYYQVGSATGDTAVATKAATVYTAAASTPSPSSASPSSLSPQTFEAWTTEQQRAYITAQGAAGPITIGSGGGAIDVFVGAGDTAASPAPVYIAQNLQKTDIAKMSFKDQQMLTQATGYPALAAAYGLMPNASTPSTGATSATATIQALIASYRSTVTTSAVPPYVQSLFTAQIDLISAQLFGGALPSAPVAGTTTTVPTAPTLPSPQTGGSAIFSEKDIQAQLDAIQTRFKRVEAFAAQATLYNPPTLISFSYQIEGDASHTTYSYQYNSDDDGKTVYKYQNPRDKSIVYSNNSPNVNRILYPGFTYLGTVPIDYSPSSFIDYYKRRYSVSDQYLGADAAGVHTYGQVTLPQSPEMSGHVFDLNGQPVSVGLVTNIVMQNTQLGFNTIQGIYPLPASTDNDVTIRSGYEKFVAQEAAITANKMLAANLAQSGTVAGSNQSLDLPKLLCLYMMYNNNIQQAVVTADSEEVNQVNAVLQAYAAAQQVINATTATSTSNANDQLQLQYGVTNVEVSRFFETSYFYSTSPIEKMYFGNAWQRPLSTKFVGVAGDGSGGGGSDTANNWTQYGTRLSDTVTQINQQSQIKMNDVNSETKQQDRYFDLASTALSKLSDTLSQIASAT